MKAYAEADTGKTCAPQPTSALVVNVRDKGAKGDGSTDDTDAIQAAIDQVAGTGGTVLVPDGVYRVGVEKSDHLKLASTMTFKLSPKAVLKAFPAKSGNYSLLDIAGATIVTVIGGSLEG
jgi:polygalacturonase